MESNSNKIVTNKFDMKSALIGFALTFLTCLVIHTIRVSDLESAVYGLTMDRQMKEQTIQQAANEINRLNQQIIRMKTEE